MLCMQPTLITVKDLDELWFQVLYQLFHNDKGVHHYTIDTGSYAGDTRLEFDYAVLHVTHPGEGPLVPYPPAGMTPPADAEQVKTDYFPNYLMSDLRGPNEEYTYGERLVNPAYPRQRIQVVAPDSGDPVDSWNFWRPEDNINQIEEVIKKFKMGHNTNQCTTEIAMPGDVLLHDPPCLRLIDWRIQNDKLHIVVYFRSWDATFGLPPNLGGLELLKQFVAEEVGVGNGEMIACSKGLHCYGQNYAYVGARLNLDDYEVQEKIKKYKKEG